MYVRTYVRMYVCMYVCMYVWVCVYIHPYMCISWLLPRPVTDFNGEYVGTGVVVGQGGPRARPKTPRLLSFSTIPPDYAEECLADNRLEYLPILCSHILSNYSLSVSYTTDIIESTYWNQTGPIMASSNEVTLYSYRWESTKMALNLDLESLQFAPLGVPG